MNLMRFCNEYGWPEKVVIDGHEFRLYDIQPLGHGKDPLPIYKGKSGETVLTDWVRYKKKPRAGKQRGRS